ncbi:MAG: pyrroline-5-carboxylate reductase [Actinomycetota bacterium]|nr:pyrroline-5-carboxylate reductase [Actinomycetota bacterium]
MAKLSLIGAGRMAEALISGILSGATLAPDDILAADVNEDRLRLINQRYSVATTTDSLHAAQAAEYILLSVKPQQIDEVVSALKPALTPQKTVISIAAGVSVARLQALAGPGVPIVRVMPNAPALVNRGMSAAALPPGLADEKKSFVDRLLRSAGEVIYVDEDLIDAVTAVSGSGPAYFFLFVRELAEAGVDAGLTREMALTLARQTFIGSAALLSETERSEDELIQAVASPGGTTEAALGVFASSDFKNIISRAVRAALDRAGELADFTRLG